MRPTAQTVDTTTFPIELAPAVRIRRTRDCVLLLAPDGVTALALDDDDVSRLAGGDDDDGGELMAELSAAGMLPGSPAPSPGGRTCWTRSGVEVAVPDRLLEAVGRLFRRLPRALVVAVGGVAVAMTLLGVASGRVQATHGGADLDPMTASLTLFAVGTTLGVLHELGHAAILLRTGARLGRFGFGFHWGAPCFYVDSTSALFLPRRQRIAQAAAGVVTELAAAAILAAASQLIGGTWLSYAAGAAMLYALSSLVVNGAPVLGLDGSLILSDLLDRPTLPTGAGRAHGRLARFYRLVDAIVGIAAIIVSLWVWSLLWLDLIGPLWNDGAGGKIAVAVAAAPMPVSVVVGIISSISVRRDVDDMMANRGHDRSRSGRPVVHGGGDGPEPPTHSTGCLH